MPSAQGTCLAGASAESPIESCVSMTEYGYSITLELLQPAIADAITTSAWPVAGCAMSADVSGSDVSDCCHEVYSR